MLLIIFTHGALRTSQALSPVSLVVTQRMLNDITFKVFSEAPPPLGPGLSSLPDEHPRAHNTIP